jgi:catechol 2,3-dioxygenase-like lactoylglutathione lyase family enzyme
MKLAQIAYLVRDYDEAIGWFIDKLGFSLVEDIVLSPAKRWVVIAPPGDGTKMLLAKADSAAQEAVVGAQAGGRVFLFLHTDDFARDHAAMTAKDVKFLEAPRQEPYGTVAVFEDLYGMKWDLIEPGVTSR